MLRLFSRRQVLLAIVTGLVGSLRWLPGVKRDRVAIAADPHGQAYPKATTFTYSIELCAIYRNDATAGFGALTAEACPAPTTFLYDGETGRLIETIRS